MPGGCRPPRSTPNKVLDAIEQYFAARSIGGGTVDVVDVGGDFPRPSARTLAAAGTKLCAVPAGTRIVIDGLAFGAMPKLAAELAGAHPLIALVHHPLALETGLSAADADRFRASERAVIEGRVKEIEERLSKLNL